MDISPQQHRTTVALAPALQRKQRDRMSADDAYQYMWCTDTTLSMPFRCRSWQDEVRLGVAVIQRQLLHSSADEVVSFIYRYSVVELVYLFRLDLGKSCVS
ncbi:hypothetical protein HAX54_021841 [Datura stramonium]|uniref:Uncharacterized protein n=1 Tax=Datura stramonium TaxID=4076 RepID=A0ABS8UVF5_DATST|nr:hypothetical protein [Datura stramonium]